MKVAISIIKNTGSEKATNEEARTHLSPFPA
jgi:hypothetical protein